MDKYNGSNEEKMIQVNVDIISERAKQAMLNKSNLLVFPQDTFGCSETSYKQFIKRVQYCKRK